MTRLIDADELKKELSEQMNFDDNCRDSVFEIIDNAPTVEIPKTIDNAIKWGIFHAEQQRPKGDLISRSELKDRLAKHQSILDFEWDNNNLIVSIIDNAPTVAESCKELHKVATERPQTIDCTNCKYESKRLIDEPCKDCNIKYSEWEAKDETN